MLFSFPGRRTEASSQILITLCSTAFVLAIFCCLPQRSTMVVQAYSKGNKKSGALLFHEKGCEHCHGANGQGGELGPDLTLVGKRKSKAQIEHQIHDGGAAMPAFGEVLQPDEIQDLVEFLHAKRKAPKKTTQPVQSATR
jgi:mono/diheme cytochrome c family protein